MTRIRVTIGTLIVSFGVILGLGARALSYQRDNLNHLRDQIRVSEQRLVAQRHDLGASEQDLSAAESQLSALPHSDELTRRNSDREAATTAWIGRVRHVQQLFEKNPEHRVPYLGLLTDEDWLRSTLRLKFDNAMSDRNALSALRMAAARRYEIPLKRALNRYALATGDATPAGVAVLTPYFDDPADSLGLVQFEVVAGNNGGGWALRSTTAPDPQNYGQIVVAPTRRLP